MQDEYYSSNFYQKIPLNITSENKTEAIIIINKLLEEWGDEDDIMWDEINNILSINLRFFVEMDYMDDVINQIRKLEKFMENGKILEFCHIYTCALGITDKEIHIAMIEHYIEKINFFFEKLKSYSIRNGIDYKPYFQKFIIERL